MYIRGLIPRNVAELAEAVPIGSLICDSDKLTCFWLWLMLEKISEAQSTLLFFSNMIFQLYTEKERSPFWYLNMFTTP